MLNVPLIKREMFEGPMDGTGKQVQGHELVFQSVDEGRVHSYTLENGKHGNGYYWNGLRDQQPSDVPHPLKIGERSL
jgi:hypothetical protein